MAKQKIKINVKDIVRRYGKDITFGAAGILLTIVLIVLFIQSVGFLVASMDSALSVKEGATTPVNIQGLKNLGLDAGMPADTTTPAP